jgi:hypothetical protein
VCAFCKSKMSAKPRRYEDRKGMGLFLTDRDSVPAKSDRLY